MTTANAANLVIIMDDFGYHKSIEKSLINLSESINVAILPDAPNSLQIANLAHQHNNDILIHLPMAPISKQSLEYNTLFPSMNKEQIQQIVEAAIIKFPYAKGLNNHMGSLMTADLEGMQHVMEVVSHHSLFFIDSKTIGHNKVKKAAQYWQVKSATRDIFLDNDLNETAISKQFDLAVKLARKKGLAIVIGHPYQQTLNVLTRKLTHLPPDIRLTKISQIFATDQPTLENNTNNEQLE